MACEPLDQEPAYRRRAPRRDPRRGHRRCRRTSSRSSRRWGCRCCEDVDLRRSTCRASTTPRWTATRCAPTTSRPTPEQRRCSFPWSASRPPGRPRPSRSRRAGRRDHDRRADAGGADAVVPIEWTDGGAGQCRASPGARAGPARPARRRRHHRPATSSLGRARARSAPGRPPRGDRPGHASRSRPRPRVVVISTGAELREPGSRSASTRSTTRTPTARGRRRERPTRSPTASASSTTTRSELTDALSDQLVRADLVVTSGGVSKGDYDVVKEVLSRLGTVEFDEVAMQPGKPQGFGTIGEDDTPIFTLPGNPVSSYVSFEVFVLPAIRRMMGQLPYRRPLVRRAAPTASRRRRGMRQFVRGRFEVTPGAPWSRPSAVTGATCSAVWHGPTPDRGPRGRPSRSRRGPRSTSSCWIGISESMNSRTAAADPRRRRPARPDGRRLGQGHHPPWPSRGRVLVSPQVVELLRGEGVPKGDALASRGSRASWAPRTHRS